MAPGLASLVFEAKSLPMASTNPMPNPPAVGAGYNAARGASKAVVPGDTPGDAPGDAPADVPVDVPIDAPFDTPFDTAIVPSVLKVSPSPSGQDESAGDRGAAAAYAGCLSSSTTSCTFILLLQRANVSTHHQAFKISAVSTPILGTNAQFSSKYLVV